MMTGRLKGSLFATLTMFFTAAGMVPAAAAQEGDVMQVVERLFDGMRTADSAAVRAVFAPEARMVSVLVRDGESVVREESVNRFVAAVGTPHDQVWDERIHDTEVRVDGPLATVWAPYAFYLGEQFSHCGVNAFELVRTAGGWKILSITDTRRREGCPAASGG